MSHQVGEFRRTLLAVSALGWGAVSVPAAVVVVDGFDTVDAVSVWSGAWGTAPVLSWDAGTLKVVADYFTPEDNGWEQAVLTRTFETPVVGSKYSAISVEVRIDPSSVPTGTGQYGYFELKRPDATPLGGVNLTSTNWTTVTFPIPPTEGELTGLYFQVGSSGFGGAVTYYFDNLRVTEIVGGPTALPLAITRNTYPGLKLFASAPGQAYQRQNLVYAPSEELANNLWWVNQTEPVTYSVTWADFPSKTEFLGFQGHLILATDSGKAVTPDWNDPHVILFEFQYANNSGADGILGNADDQVLARARFLHKVNEPAGNGMLYRGAANAAAGPVGVLGEIWAPAMEGTWSVTLKPDRTIILTGPDKVSINLTMPASEAPFYEPTGSGVSAIFGIQPNADTRIGLSATISRIKITQGTKVVVDDRFLANEIDPEKWTVRAQDAAGLIPAGPDLAFFVSWPLPDTGYKLKFSAGLTGVRTDTSGAFLVGAKRFLKLNQSALSGTETGFYQLVK